MSHHILRVILPRIIISFLSRKIFLSHPKRPEIKTAPSKWIQATKKSHKFNNSFLTELTLVLSQKISKHKKRQTRDGK
jgi:hypothetical protein